MKCIGWAYSGEYDDYYFAPTGSGEFDKSNELVLTVVGKDIKLSFAKNEWSGKVSVTDEYGKTETLSLSPDESSDDRVVYVLNTARSYSIAERILYNAGAAVVLTFAFRLILVLIIRLKNKKAKASKS